MAKLPSAFLCGVRVQSFDTQHCATKVSHRWINQNPFKSMYFAVELMAAELSTGLLLLTLLREQGLKAHTLVIENKAKYHKKAVGKIVFECTDATKIMTAIQDLKTQNTPKAIELSTNGRDSSGDTVVECVFTWSLKLKG